MRHPPGFTHQVIYDLKQSPRAWFHYLNAYLLDISFINGIADSSLFMKRSGSSILAVIMYVDDISVTGNDTSMLHNFISGLCSTFDCRDLGNLRVFLGMEITPTSSRLSLSQSRYIVDLLNKFGLANYNPCSTPMVDDKQLSLQDNDPLLGTATYQSMVGGLQYLIITIPDIAFAFRQVSQYVQSPKTPHLQVVKQIFLYFIGTLHMGLSF